MRVTGCAQEAVRHAGGEARRRGHGRERLLLALLRHPACLATATLGERRVEAAAGPVLELRWDPPATPRAEAPPLVVSTVVL